MANPAFVDIAKQFTEFYYQTFDSDRSKLDALYRPGSMLTWEGTPILGAEEIIKKLVSLPFATVQHKISTQDAQPAASDSRNILVSVTGLLVVDDSQNPLHFSQVFQLVPDGNSYFVMNDMFRLNYG